MINNSCDKLKQCGHYCSGFKDEKECLPCLDPSCADVNILRDQNSESECMCSD